MPMSCSCRNTHSVPVINGLSDGYHPCQALGDMLTIHEHFGALDGLRLAFVGDGNNVAASVALACAHFGVSFRIATPEGYEIQRPVREQAYGIAGRNGSVLEMGTRPQVAVTEADVVYTILGSVWGKKRKRPSAPASLIAYQVNEELLGHANSNAIVMHCLPAHRGDEITDAVMDGAQSKVFQQAENRMHAQKAILARPAIIAR